MTETESKKEEGGTEEAQLANQRAFLEDWEDNLKQRERKMQGSQMKEAKYSVNFTFLQQGFRTQITVRNNESLDALIMDYQNAFGYAMSKGAVPEPAPGRNGNGNSKTAVGSSSNAPLTCEYCGSTKMRYVATRKDGTPVGNYVCDNCGKWRKKPK